MILIPLELVKTPKKIFLTVLLFLLMSFARNLNVVIQQKTIMVISTFSNEKYLLNQEISFHIYSTEKNLVFNNYYFLIVQNF